MTSFTVTVDGTDYSSRMIYANISPKSLSVGQTSALLFLDNSDGALNAAGAIIDMKKHVAVVSVDGVEFFRGYVQSYRHLYGDVVKDQFGQTVVTRLFCIDFSADFSNRLISESYPSATTATTLLASLVNGTEITYGGADASTFGGLECRREPRISVVRELCNRTDHEAYVTSIGGGAGGFALQFFAIDTVASGITLASSDILYAELGCDSMNVRNNFDVYGDKTLSLPSDLDWADVQKDTVAGDAHLHNLGYTQIGIDHLMSPGASNYANPLHLTFDCKYVFDEDGAGAGTQAWYKVEYKLGAGAWVDTSTVDISFNNGDYPNVQTVYLSPSVWNTHPPELGEDVTVRVLMKVETDNFGSAHIKDFNLYWHDSEAYHVGTTGDLKASTTNVRGTYSLFFADTAVASASFQTFFSPAINVRLNEHGYGKLHFYIYAICGTGPISSFQVNLYSDYAGGKYFYKQMPCAQNNWVAVDLDLGVNNSWTEVNAPDWTAIVAIEYVVNSQTAVDNISFYIDDLRFTEGPQHYGPPTAGAFDAGSIADYGQRDYEEEIGVTTLADITARATDLLAKLHDPLVTLHLVVDGALGVVGGADKWLPGNTLSVTCASLGIAAPTVYRMLSIELECFPKSSVELGHEFVAILDCVDHDRKLYGRSFRAAAKPNKNPPGSSADLVVGSGTGGGGAGSR